MQPTITTLPLTTLASGDRLSLQVYKFIGAHPGKKVYIQSNLHGCELAGNAVIYHLLEDLQALDAKALQGEIWIVPMCNPLGVNQRSHHFASGRYNPYDGKDWNRIFWDYEKQGSDIAAFAKTNLKADVDTIQRKYRQKILAAFQAEGEKLLLPQGVEFHKKYRHVLQSLCLDADYVIDLHSSTNEGMVYTYYFRDREDSTQLFQLPAAILLDSYDGDAFDESFMKPWLALESAFKTLGRSLQFDIEAYTFELATGMKLDPAAVFLGLRGVKNYLVKKGVVTSATFGQMGKLEPVQPVPETLFVTHEETTRYCAPTGGMVQPAVAIADAVKQGQVLYRLLCFNKEGQRPKQREIVAHRDGVVFDIATNRAVNEGEYVLGLM